MINFAGIDDFNILKLLFMSSFTANVTSNNYDFPIKNDEYINEDFDFNKSSILEKINLIFRQIVSSGCEDLKTLNMILNFVGNCIQDGIARKIIQETSLIEGLSYFVENRSNLQSDILSHVTWIVENIVK